jgi:DNA modification methylase
MIPNRVAITLQDAGWYIRSEIIWHKPNPMPESVRDRPTSCHEKIWLITKNKKYYYDAESIKEPITDTTAIRLLQKNIDNQRGSSRANGGMKSNGNMKAMGRKKFDKNMGGSGTSFVDHSGYKKADGTYMINPTRNKRNVWTITTKPFKDAHFATFPKDLIEPCIKAGCPEGGVVLDPFGGSGTTGIVAALNNRNAILIELNQNYIDIANKRIDKEVGLFNG